MPRCKRGRFEDGAHIRLYSEIFSLQQSHKHSETISGDCSGITAPLSQPAHDLHCARQLFCKHRSFAPFKISGTACVAGELYRRDSSNPRREIIPHKQTWTGLATYRWKGFEHGALGRSPGSQYDTAE